MCSWGGGVSAKLSNDNPSATIDTTPADTLHSSADWPAIGGGLLTLLFGSAQYYHFRRFTTVSKTIEQTGGSIRFTPNHTSGLLRYFYSQCRA